MSSNHQTLVSMVNSMTENHTTQVGVTRTRAQLLSVKKLTDVIRKELLTHGKSLKQSRKPKPPTSEDESASLVQPVETTV